MTRSWMQAHAGKGSKAPPMPELPTVLRIAEETGASLDYLLLGLPPMFRSQIPREGESFEEHFHRATVEHLSARRGYDPMVVRGLIAEPRVLWKIWTSATAAGVEAQLEAEHAEGLRATRRRRLRGEDAVVAAVERDVAATTVALNEAREKGLKQLLKITKERQSTDEELLNELVSLELARSEPRRHALAFLLRFANQLEVTRPTEERRISKKLTAALERLGSGE